MKQKPKLEVIAEDRRGCIYLVDNLLEKGKELTFMEMKKGSARGGCYHGDREWYAVIKGKVNYISGPVGGPYIEKILITGESGTIEAGTSHSFVALEDSIISEWGIMTHEKKSDIKDLKLRKIVNEFNEKI